ncbi:MAG: hypothetical protein HC908_11350 [Calothrix sp. SM1_7_51]|nr:hypothetical protein [Calothrix sp. SM1_7_51]
MSRVRYKVLRAIEQLGYRVSVADIVSHTGLELYWVQENLLVLAADTNAHLQVTESGDIVYLFSQNLRFFWLKDFACTRLLKWSKKIWWVVLYLIRILFGIALLVSTLVICTIIWLVVTAVCFVISEGSDNTPGVTNSNFWLLATRLVLAV